jgi:hypothetical protein
MDYWIVIVIHCNVGTFQAYIFFNLIFNQVTNK